MDEFQNNTKYQDILKTAHDLFWKFGIRRVTIEEICREANVSKMTFYKYFRNKEAIYISVLNHGIELMTDMFRKHTDESESFLEAIETLFDGLTRFTRRYRPYVEIWVDLSSCSMNRFAAELSAKVEAEGRKLFRGLIEKAKDKGELDASLNTDLVTYALDCHMTLFTYSLVSEYHHKRFSAFFKDGLRGPTQKEKIALVVESAKLLVES